MMQAGDKLKGKANEAGRKAQNAVGDNAGLPSPQDVRPIFAPSGMAQLWRPCMVKYPAILQHSVQVSLRVCNHEYS